MRPTVLSNANANAAAGVGGGGGNNTTNTNANGITIPIHHEYGGSGGGNVGGSHPQTSAYYAGSPSTAAYGSPRQQQQQAPQQQAYHPQGPQGSAQQQQQQQPHGHPHQHFQQGFGFEPDMDMDMDMDMFPRSRLGRMHDPFGTFNNSHFGFPQFNSLGRRRAADHMGRDDDFFNRLPSEFRQYIPEGFGHRRAGEASTLPRQHTGAGAGATAAAPQQQQVPVQGGGSPGYYHQAYVPASSANGVPQQTPSKKLCDAAIQTEDPTVRAAGGDQVDNASAQTHHAGDNLKQHGLRNTVDMGVKSALESEQHGARAHSAPPQEQQQGPLNGKRQTPPPQAGHSQFGTQTSPHVQGVHKAYYPPQQQPHPQQQQRHESTPPQPQTPGGTYIRTIPIFVEGRSEPIINAHKEIPNQNSAPPPQARAQQQQQHKPQQQQQQHQQQHRPTPINTQQQQQAPQGAAGGLPPQTPHTLDSISKIQDIQRDVLDLMGHVEKFTGTRQDKEYAYLDEMLTRNLLKLDTIDTNGKDSIRLARKEAIKCIQASINVLEAKANENTKAEQQAAEGGSAVTATAPEGATDATAAPPQTESKTAARKSASKEKVEAGGEKSKAATDTADKADQPADAKQMQAPIPLPPPEGMQVNEGEAGAAASTTAATAAPAAADGSDTNSAQTSESPAGGGAAAEAKGEGGEAAPAAAEGTAAEVSSKDAAESNK